MTKFICIGGKAQHGKSTTAMFLKEELEQRGHRVLYTNYADLLKYICKSFFGWNGEKDNAGRSLLQKVGTEMIRAHNPNYWVDFILNMIEFFPAEWDYVVIGDVRFPNEISRIKERGYECTYVKVIRTGFETPLTPEQQNHSSETSLDSVEANWLLLNQGTLDELRRLAKLMCDDFLEPDRTVDNEITHVFGLGDKTYIIANEEEDRKEK